MSSIQKGVLICSAGILLSFIIYFFLQILPNIERLPPAEQNNAWFTTLFHLPSIFPGLLGLFVFRKEYLGRKILKYYLISLVLFILTYGWSIIAPGAIAAGIPVILLLWPVNLILSLLILNLFLHDRNKTGDIN